MPREGADPFSQLLARIPCERVSFEYRDEDVQAYRKHISNLQEAAQINAAARAQEEDEYRAWKAQYPGLLENFPAFASEAEAKRVAVFLDYDGTLTPIVKNPDRAFMSDQMREVVRAVARLFPTAIISGRGREKVEGFVKLKELYYAGSHGMDIIGPRGDGDEDGSRLAFQPAARFGPIMDQVHDDLVSRVSSIAGATVEHNKFCVSVHFRNCEASQYDSVLSAVEDTLREHEELHATRGRKVFEIRPQVDWDKGHALLHLLEAMGLGKDADVLPIYIGDDRTDEDAFGALKGRTGGGCGILVSSKAKPTEAVYTLRDPHEVLAFLSKLIGWGRTPSNAWHQAESCIGWALDLSSSAANGYLPAALDNLPDIAVEPDYKAATPDGIRSAFGLRVLPRSGMEAFGNGPQKSPLSRGGRPPLPPPSMPSTPSAGGAAGEGSLSRGASPRASLQAAATAPAAVSVASIREDVVAADDSPSIDLAQLSIKDAGASQSAPTSMMAEIPEQAPLPPVEKLINGYNLGALSPFSALATGPHVFSLPEEAQGMPITRDSSTLSGGYSSGGESMHFTPSGSLVTEGEATKAG